MISINEARIYGKVSRDPEVSYTSTGKAVCRFSVAYSKLYFVNGEPKRKVSFFEVKAWEKVAEACMMSVKKGDLIYIEGELVQERWNTKDGMKRSMNFIVPKVVIPAYRD